MDDARARVPARLVDRADRPVRAARRRCASDDGLRSVASVTVIYRSTQDEPPFGRGNFWTMWPASAEFVAEVEAGTPNLPAQSLYHYEVVVGDRAAEQSVDDLLPLLEGTSKGNALPRLRDALLERGEKLAASGYAWVQFTDHGRSWHGAMLYLGDERIPARPASGVPG